MQPFQVSAFALIFWGFLVLAGISFNHYEKKFSQLQKTEPVKEGKNVVLEVAWVRVWLYPLICLIVSFGAGGLYLNGHHHQTHMILAGKTGFSDGWMASCDDIYSKSPSNSTFFWRGTMTNKETCLNLMESYLDDYQYRRLEGTTEYEYTRLNPQVLDMSYQDGYSISFREGVRRAASSLFQEFPELCFGNYCLTYYDVDMFISEEKGRNYFRFR
jgi:hypothetical protein